MARFNFRVPKGTVIGWHRGGEILAAADTDVEVTIDDAAVMLLCRKAVRNKRHESRSGPVLARVIKRG